MIDICTQLHSYRVAVAELPMRTRAVSSVQRAVAVIPGDRRWATAACTAFDEGATAVIIEDPAHVEDGDCIRLDAAAAGRPVLVDRPMLRADISVTAAAAVVAPSYAVVDLAATAGRQAAVARDAVGWMRALGGGRPEVEHVGGTRASSIMLVQHADAAVPGVLTMTTLAGTDQGAWIRGAAIAGTRVEVIVDEASSQATVDVSTAAGTLRHGRRYESRARLTLRRTIDALAGAAVSDLADLRADAAIAALLRPSSRR